VVGDVKMDQETQLYNLPMEDEVQMEKVVYELEQLEKAGQHLPDEVQDWLVYANNKLWSI
jgi:hypothetical protein